MSACFLLFDLGNTFLKIVVANQTTLLKVCTLPTEQAYLPNILASTLTNFLQQNNLDGNKIRACLASSVVPQINPLLSDVVQQHCKQTLLFIPKDLPVPLVNHYEHPAELGNDRLIAAFAARQLCPEAESLIVVDYGTAITFDCVSGKDFLGGVIVPGAEITLDALAQHAVQLPKLMLDWSFKTFQLGRSTSSCIQLGVTFGLVSLTEGLLRRLKEKLPPAVKVIATGQLASVIFEISPLFDRIVPLLVPEGLRLLLYAQ